MEKKILIFAATYNEAENISSFIKQVVELNINLDLLIVDDNSPDKTWEIVSSYKRKNKNIYGTTTPEEAEELSEEGIELTTIPWIEKKDN